MRFEIGNSGRAPFKVFLRDGREITDQIRVKELTCHLCATGGLTEVFMTVYADSVTVFSDQVEVSIAPEPLPPKRSLLKRLFSWPPTPRSLSSRFEKPTFAPDGL